MEASASPQNKEAQLIHDPWKTIYLVIPHYDYNLTDTLTNAIRYLCNDSPANVDIHPLKDAPWMLRQQNPAFSTVITVLTI